MSKSSYTSIHLAKRPKSNIVPGETFESKTNNMPKASDLNDGEVLFKTLYLSLDPAMRGWLNGASISHMSTPIPTILSPVISPQPFMT